MLKRLASLPFWKSMECTTTVHTVSASKVGNDLCSQLAVELAKRFNGEIINGDAMQLYAGLPIITNKITIEEQEGVPHHLLGCIGLREQTWVVGTFVKKALAIIGDIQARGRLPILVGGTHYYTQSLLFRDRFAEEGQSETTEESHSELKFPVLQEPTEILLAKLQDVDPVMAQRWHPNDRRKIQRSLEIYLKTGRKASDVYADQRDWKNIPDGDVAGVGSSMRFPTILFWVHADTEPLRTRLDQRVDKMVQAGLLEEVSSLRSSAIEQQQAGQRIDETRGIWVSIGYKEYKPYLDALESQLPNAAKQKDESLERTKISTRQYAKRQVQWIRIKLANALAGAGAGKDFYLLDGSDLSTFSDSVVASAIEITKSFLQGEPRPSPESLSNAAAELLKPKRNDLSLTPEKWIKQHCDFCDITCVTEDQWEKHIKSKPHRKTVSKRKQREAHQAAKPKEEAPT
nr:trna dimethylallyltransferase, mitochondrial [Quercus suber]